MDTVFQRISLFVSRLIKFMGGLRRSVNVCRLMTRYALVDRMRVMNSNAWRKNFYHEPHEHHELIPRNLVVVRVGSWFLIRRR